MPILTMYSDFRLDIQELVDYLLLNSKILKLEIKRFNLSHKGLLLFEL